MKMNDNVDEQQPHAPVDPRVSRELIKRILKLHWLGMEKEAEKMQVALRHVDPDCTFLAGPCDTD